MYKKQLAVYDVVYFKYFKAMMIVHQFEITANIKNNNI